MDEGMGWKGCIIVIVLFYSASFIFLRSFSCVFLFPLFLTVEKGERRAKEQQTRKWTQKGGGVKQLD